MSLKVYFDNTLIDEQYYTGLNNNNELFNDSFKLGSTPCNQFTLKVAKEGVTQQPTTIKLYDELIQFADLKIDNIEEQDYEYVYTLTDRMIDLNFNYDASEIFENGHTTLYNIALDICTKTGLFLGTANFRGYDKQITWYDNTRTAREYIGFIAELNGGFARIENNILYFVKQKRNSVKTIDIDDCEDFKIGERHLITRVVYELGAVKYEFGNESGNTLYLNSDNVYITSESEVEAIYNDINGFEFYSYTTSNCPIDYDIKAGDVITFTDGENEYPTIVQYDLEYFGEWYGGYDLEVNTERQEETQIIGDKQNIKNLRIIVDRDANIITQVVEEVGEQNQKIAQVTQTVNELNSKISDIADITTQQETLNGSLQFTDINQSEPIEIKIHPTTTNISYLYPRADLYPSDILYMPDRTLKFTNTTTEEVFYYTLPDDLLISQNGVYDEFYLGYDQQVCQVIKRCGYNADGTVYELAQEEIHTYAPYPSIPLTDGDYTIELLGYNNAYISMRLMAQNIYTTQFATKTEVNSEISQTADNINASVTQKLTNYSTTTEMNSAINLKVGEISSTVSQVNSKADANAQNITRLQQTTNSISATVSNNNTKANIIAKINDNTSQAKIEADVIDLNANDILNLIAGNQINLTSKNITIASNNFSVDANGNMTANSGRIGGWTIENGKMYAGDGSNVKTAVMQAPASNVTWVLAAGGSTHTGYGDCPFRVDKLGNLYSTSANISGTINSSSGTIGGFTIGANSIEAQGNSYRVFISNASNVNKDFLVVRTGSDSSNYQYPFFVRGDGTLHAEKAEISGSITATSGTFQNCTITNSCTVPASTVNGSLATSNIPNLSAGKITSGTLNGNNVSVTNLSASNISKGTLNQIPVTNSSISNGSITNATYKFQGGSECITINEGGYGTIMGYYTTNGTTTSSTRRYSLVAFNNGGRFQTFNSSGTMAAYFDHQGAHTSSDIRLKDKISNINEKTSFNIINNLTPIEYVYKSDETIYHRGLSAQEVEKVLKDNDTKKEIYEINQNGEYSLNYSELIPDLINCVKYLNNKIEELEKRLEGK